MQVASVKVHIARPALAQRTTAVKARRSVLVHGAPDKQQIDAAVKEAEEACKGGDAGEW